MAWLLACGSQPSPLDASVPLVERNGDALVLRWTGAPAGRSMPVYAGPSPDRIDRRTSVGEPVDGRAEISPLPFEGRPFFEIRSTGNEPLIVAERRYLDAGLDAMREKRGSIDAYLELDLGLGPAERNRLRSILLEPT